MSAEILLTAGLRAGKNGVSVEVTVQKTIDMAGTRMVNKVQAIGTTAEQITFEDVTPGYICLVNRDTTNYVDIAIENTVATPFTSLKPGEAWSGPAKSGASYYAKANTAAVDLQVVAVAA